MLLAAILSMVLLMQTSAPPAAPSPAPDSVLSHDAALALGRLDTKRFYSGQEKPLWETMSSAMKAGLKEEDALEKLSQQIHVQFGSEDRVLHEDALPAPHGIMVYTRVVKFRNYSQPLVVTFAFGAPRENGEATIEGFHITPEANPAPSSYMEYKDRTPLQFPLSGMWTIYQGGRTAGENYHVTAPDQRFAYDMVLLRNSSLYSGDGSRNVQYYGFAQPVFADAQGRVMLASDLIADNPPNQPSLTSQACGNSVVIDHGNGEFSMYAHLKQGSVLVKTGDLVKSGEQIALTGNSGNSPFTHLHYHLQTTGAWFSGEGLPIQFRDVALNGIRMDQAEPVRGDTIQAFRTGTE